MRNAFVGFGRIWEEEGRRIPKQGTSWNAGQAISFDNVIRIHALHEQKKKVLAIPSNVSIER